METFTINQCADFLNIHVSTALTLAGQGKIKGAKIGRAWVFIKSDVEDYLRSCVQAQQEELSTKATRTIAMLQSDAVKRPIIVTSKPKRRGQIDLSKYAV